VGVIGLVVGLVVVLSPTPSSALTVYAVTSLTDGAPGSLRAAIDSANGDGDASEINLPADADVVLDVCGGVDNVNASGDLDITADEPLTINGHGSTVTQTCAGQRVVQVLGAAAVQMWELTITGGDQATLGETGNGGGVSLDNPSGSLLVALSSIVGNRTENVGGGITAPLGDTRTVSIFDSTIADNTAESGAGIWGGAPLIVNSTISGNHIEGFGSGGAMRGGPAELLYVTIVDNDAGTDTLPGQISSDLTVTASAIGAASDGGPNCAVFVAVTSGGYNVEQGDDCGLGDPTDQVDTDPVLGALADNGGQTLTHLPGAGSPLVDNIPIDDCDITYVADQRNVARPQGDGCDTGSVEVVVVEDDGTPTPPGDSTPGGSGAATTPRFTG
jgi:hypothetical protein